MVLKDELGVGLCRKPTRLLMNMEPVAEMMSKTCTGGHRHVALISGRPSAAAIYPPKCCAMMVDGIQMWTRQRQERVDNPLMGLEWSDLVEPEEGAKIEECGTYMTISGGWSCRRNLLARPDVRRWGSLWREAYMKLCLGARWAEGPN